MMLWTGPALGSPDEVILDYREDGVIESSHSSEDLWSALERWRATGTANYGEFAEAVDTAFDTKQLGVQRDARAAAGEQQANEVVRGTGASAPLPAPPEPGSASRPPMAFIGLSALAVLLLMAGVGAAIARRMRRDTP
jgi:hypothetical protein